MRTARSQPERGRISNFSDQLTGISDTATGPGRRLLPALYQWAETAREGGLLAYGPRFSEPQVQWARQLAKVLRGAKPADLPVQQPTKFTRDQSGGSRLGALTCTSRRQYDRRA